MAQALVRSAGRILRKQFFSEEKNQKTFDFSGCFHGRGSNARKMSRHLSVSARTKSLLLLFFRKEESSREVSAYVAASRRILEEIDDAERAASGEYRAPRGHLAIAAPIMFGSTMTACGADRNFKNGVGCPKMSAQDI